MLSPPAPNAEFFPCGKSPYDNGLSAGREQPFVCPSSIAVGILWSSAQGCVVSRVKFTYGKTAIGPRCQDLESPVAVRTTDSGTLSRVL
jgi:hypothetical protein